jgi:hypothetical protein
MTDIENGNLFARCERGALLMARSFAIMATGTSDEQEAEGAMALGREIQRAIMAHRALFGELLDFEVAEA